MSKAAAVVDELLEEAASFVRGSDFTGARERVRFARDELSRLAARHEVAGQEEDELGAHIDLTLERYDRLLAKWQRQNEARHASYLVRERAVIEAGMEPRIEAARARWISRLRRKGRRRQKVVLPTDRPSRHPSDRRGP